MAGSIVLLSGCGGAVSMSLGNMDDTVQPFKCMAVAHATTFTSDYVMLSGTCSSAQLEGRLYRPVFELGVRHQANCPPMAVAEPQRGCPEGQTDPQCSGSRGQVGSQ
jgi:hypothetical protein